MAEPVTQKDVEEALKNVQVRIIEQPAKNKHRFRYKSEGRATGTLLGENSTDDVKTYPKVKIMGYQGPAHLYMSCVDEKSPYRIHPNKLASKGNVYDRVKIRFDQDNMIATLKNIGIQSITKTQIMESLKEKEEAKVDPFKQGYNMNPGLIILGKLRLCFEVILEHPKIGQVILPPIVSQVVKDRKMFGALKIVDISETKATFAGGTKIFLFCTRVQKSDIEIHFQFEDEALTNIVITPDPSEVHEQYGIKFISPVCKNSKNTQVKAKLYLSKPSDGSISPSIDFHFVPKTFPILKKKTDSLKLVKSSSRKSMQSHQTYHPQDINMTSTSQL